MNRWEKEGLDGLLLNKCIDTSLETKILKSWSGPIIELRN